MKGDIEKILNKEQIKNVEHAQKYCEEGEYEYKISQVIKIFGGKLTKEDVCKEVKASKVAALYIAKSSKKQNITEKYVLNELKKINATFCKMPASGKNAIRFTSEGKIALGGKDVKNTKSVDYMCEIDGKKWYFAQKYTTHVGGAQDNQCEDAIKFIDYALKCENRDFGLGLVLDGDYYDDKIDNFKAEYNCKNDCLVFSAEDLSKEEIKILKGKNLK